MAELERAELSTAIIDEVSAAVAKVCEVIESNRLKAEAAGLAISYEVKFETARLPVEFACMVRFKEKP